jgi:hypothetical protein
LDFSNLLRYPPPANGGIILLRVLLLPPGDIIAMIKDLMSRVPESAIHGFKGPLQGDDPGLMGIHKALDRPGDIALSFLVLVDVLDVQDHGTVGGGVRRQGYFAYGSQVPGQSVEKGFVSLHPPRGQALGDCGGQVRSDSLPHDGGELGEKRVRE